MASSSRISNAAAKAALDAITALIGSGGLLRIYTGSAPTNVEDSASGTLLAELTMNSTPFGASTDANPNALATANSITQDSSANASGDAGYYRIVTSGGTGVVQGNVGTSAASLIVPTITIVAGQPVSCSSLTITLPEVGT